MWRLVSPPGGDERVHSLDGDEQVAVLVDVVEFAKFGQPVAYIPLLVRLYILDDLVRLRADTGNQEGNSSQPALPSLPVWMIKDREIRSPVRRPFVKHDELIRKVIEGAAEVVHAVPEDKFGIWI